MTPAQSIARLGFRKWYERQLLEAHAWLITALLSVLMVAASFEGLMLRLHGWQTIVELGAILGGCALAALGWTRYRVILLRAERYGDAANCPRCATYARFRVESIDAAGGLQVRCRHCGEPWTLRPRISR